MGCMPEVKMRYNPDEGQVELVVDGEVAMSSGKEEFRSWVDYENEQNPPAPPEPSEEDKLRQELEDTKAELEVLRAASQSEPPASDDSVAEVDSDEAV